MSTAIHGNLVSFWKDLSIGEKDRGRRELVKHIAMIDDQLGEQSVLPGDRMSIADPYLFRALGSVPVSGVESKRLQAHYNRLSKDPSVTQALAEEDLV